MYEAMNREKAWEILSEYTKNPALIRHALCVEAAMRYYAKLSGADEEQWGIAGLLHDFDYERWPEPPEHTREGAKVLREAGFDEEVVGTVLAHVPWNLEEYPRDRPIRKTIYAVDELCGFLHAAALVRPERLVGMKPKSIVKKMKQKAFAAAVSREDIHAGAELLGIPLAEHIQNCIEALQSIAVELDLLPAQEPGAPEE
jgi:putative nucleotidyltransferase with HDIG domain